ncbi:NACHT domain-containing protein [Streptomyces sp. HUAS 31]|uniref:NACHT domain-containing protein n=1 Tax=Streptomyces sp. HUAS 31 TaxID=3020055 RepID=UPI0023061214|nr:NACHT domain-containing protein [Streptomyces sp. HUAS 31]WCD95039.1 NACHT domain-containing protein [Streptomyces sp. HUAS 31]
MLAEVAAGVIVEAVVSTARWFRRETAGGEATEVALLRWFDTYALEPSQGAGPTLPDGVPSDAVRDFFRHDDSQALLHELMASRLTDAPEAVITKLREAYASCAHAALDPVFAQAGIDAPEVAAGTLAEDFFDHCDLEIAGFVGQLSATDSTLLDRIRQEAFSARVVAVLGAIERHTRALSLRDSSCLAAEQAFVSTYRRQAAFAHRALEPPDFERRRRVPIGDLYVSPGITALLENRAAQDDGASLDLTDLQRALDRTVLLGDPGCGKSTACQVLLHRQASDPGARVPFLVVLREFALADQGRRSVVDHIEYRLETYYQCPAPPGAVDRLLLSGGAVVVFDGLDELVDTTRRREMTEIVELFCVQYPLAPVLVTSRAVGYDEARLDDRLFECFQLGPFDTEQSQEYVEKWFAQEEVTPEDARRSASSFLTESSGLPDLCANPLMLALMCILYRGTSSLPRNRPEVYEQCASLLFRKWDVRRRIHVELSMARLVEPALRHLAFWLLTRRGDAAAVAEREIVDRVMDFLDERGFEDRTEARAAAQQFVGFCRGRAWVFSDVGTDAQGESLYTFTHRTFLEYFAAAQLASTSDTPEVLARRLAPRVTRQEWDVVGQLAVQIKDRTTDAGAARVFTTLLSDRRRRSVASRGNLLAFLARCLTCVDPPPRTVRRLARATVEHLMLGDPATECSAPLAALLRSSWDCRDVVTDEISHAIDEAVRSDDPTRRRAALLLAGYAGYAFQGAYSSPAHAHWEEFSKLMIARHAVEFLAIAPDHTGLMDVCLGNGLTDLGDCFQRCELDFGSLWQGWQMGIFGPGAWYPYASRCVFVLLLGTEGCRPLFETTVRDCTAAGAWLVRNPEPPWTDRADDVSAFLITIGESLAAREGQRLPELTPEGYLGAAVMLLASLEASREPSVERIVPELGPLTQLAAYVLTRYGNDGTHLPDLPVPGAFHGVLRAWARREVNFVRRA